MAENKKISTRLVLRNDDLSAWNASQVELLKGEAALARLTGDLSDFYEVRIGTGDKTWSQLGSSNIRIPAKNVEGLEQSITSLSTSFHYVGSDGEFNALSATANNGDFAVVSSEIATGKVSYTAYRFNSEVKAWQALDGNYDASNVYFDDDITMAGEYTNIGAVSKGSNDAVSTFAVKGKSVKEAFTSIFLKDNDDAKVSQPDLSAYVTTVAAEVGTKVYPKYKLSRTLGSYTYGSKNTGESYNPGTQVSQISLSAVDSQSYENTNVTNNTEFTSTKDYQFTESAQTILTGYYSWSDGATPATMAHNTSPTKQAIKAGNTTKTANLPAGYRRVFYGAVAAGATQLDIGTITSDNVRALGPANSGSSAPSSFTAPAGTKQIWFFLRHGLKKGLTAKDGNALNAPVAFTKAENAVNVEGANKYAVTAYDAWYCILDAASGAAKAMALSLTWN